ncbi:MAG TPA: STAS domain-containing protein [Planctomycetota bacterium]|nr:STAS domain-containing protein [Planctomycetota bacterium]
MQLKLEERNGVLIATPQVDRLDVKTVPEFRDEIVRAVENHAKVILNLELINFVDSTGLGALMSVIRRLNQKGGGLRLAGLQQQVTAMFRLVRMHKIFDTFDNVNDALAGW